MTHPALEGKSFRWLLESATDPMIIAGGDGRILLANAAVEQLFGYSGDELLGLPVDTLVPERFRQAHQAQRTEYCGRPLQRPIGRGPTVYGVRKDGTEFPAEVSLSPLETADGLLVMAAIHDISERRQAEERQARLVSELESANEELKSFAYVVSHDLKAPLRAIGSLADWIATDYGDKFDQAGKELLQLLTSRVRRMDGLIDGILQYSRVGRVRETRVPVDLEQLVHDVIDLLAPPPHVRITVDTPLPTVTADRTRMQQVFQNLLGNAIRYLDKPQGTIRVGCTAQPDGWRFSIADNGPGIEPRQFEKIFQLFQTLAPRDKVESTGVGLALTKKVVELYGGHIWVESAPGKGSTFFFTLPRACAPTGPTTKGKQCE